MDAEPKPDDLTQEVERRMRQAVDESEFGIIDACVAVCVAMLREQKAEYERVLDAAEHAENTVLVKWEKRIAELEKALAERGA